MDDFIRKATHEFCKEVLLKTAMESTTIRNKLSFIEHVKLCEYANNISYKEGVELVFELGVRDYESKFGRLLKMGLAAAAGGFIAAKFGFKRILGFGVGIILTYMFKKFTDPCWLACRKESKTQEICKYTCFIKGCDSVIRDITNQINKCDQTPNPLSCERKLNKALISWKEKKENYREKLELAKEKYAEREAKSRLKDRERELKARGA